MPIPHDCTDGFLGAYWRRPAVYLDPSIRESQQTALDTGMCLVVADL